MTDLESLIRSIKDIQINIEILQERINLTGAQAEHYLTLKASNPIAFAWERNECSGSKPRRSSRQTTKSVIAK